MKVSDNNSAALFIKEIQRDYQNLSVDWSDDLIFISTESFTVNRIINRALAVGLQLVACVYRV